MKRGRPNIRGGAQPAILRALSINQSPLTTSAIKRKISEELGREVSWNTTLKYIRELLETGKICAIQLPHSKTPNKEGLRVYSLKR